MKNERWVIKKIKMKDLKGVVVIGATNRPDIIDEALLRPGRFDRILEIPIPKKEARKQIFEIHLKKKPIDSTVNVDKLAELTDGYTGADIAAIVNAAAMSAIKDQISSKSGDKNNITTTGHKQQHLTISMKHMEAGLQKISKKGKDIRNTEIMESPNGEFGNIKG